jgi:hypothetical protein
MVKHWISLMNAHEGDKATDYLLANAYDTGADTPLSDEKKAGYGALMKMMTGNDEMKKTSFVFGSLEMEGEDRAKVIYSTNHPETGQQKEENHMVKKNGRWWFETQ